MASPRDPSMKATLRQGAPAGGGALPSSIGTLAGLAPLPPGPMTPVDLGDTLDAASVAPPASGVERKVAPAVASTAAGRTTVLPRHRPAGLPAAEGGQRFEPVRVLGEGGMGLVELVRDNDIRRTVAVKKLHADAQSEQALLRFADEVRIVGQLEHPSIVPVYDVGRDESGQVYLVMKHLTGETMEQVIEKLRAGDPAYLARFSLEHRVHLFLGVLDAIRYAHARGVIHRDLKPANIMIGPYGEVVVLDWGIAKPIRRAGPSSSDAHPLERTLVDSHDRRLQETQLGSLAGTPLYMSPEQAAGRNDELDERSDVYSLCVVLYEWLALEHPIQGVQTVTEVLAAIISGDDNPRKTGFKAIAAGIPAHWANLLPKGLVRDRDRRFQSVAQLEEAIQAVLDGHVRIECHVTLTKRVVNEVLSWIDRHPMTFFFLFYGASLLLVGALGVGAYRLVRSF